ncbi:uncharacterized protein V1518DRAFT_78818 [Limtongia smithiae]|uniref:uncharacterized protein n=1 Tax=Limtongia smithiae TaxID=1125753 RepID=UPI0034CE1804
MAVLNLEDQLSFYMAYHNQPVNVAIHALCIPMILVTSFALGTNTGPLLPMASCALSQYTNLGVLVSIGYAVFYVLLDPMLGSLVFPLVIGSAVVGTDFIASHGACGNYITGAIWTVCWIAQFVGHGVFEKRAPALLDSLVQALVLAPFFVAFEIVFKLGFRKALHERLSVRVAAEIQKFRASKASPAAVSIDEKK